MHDAEAWGAPALAQAVLVMAVNDLRRRDAHPRHPDSAVRFFGDLSPSSLFSFWAHVAETRPTIMAALVRPFLERAARRQGRE
jgi:hypothetical protein